MAKTTHSLFTIRWKDGPEKKPSDIGGHSDHITLGLGLRLGGVRFRTLGMFSWRSFILFASSGPGVVSVTCSFEFHFALISLGVV